MHITRVANRLVSYEVVDAGALGWVAVGVVVGGLRHETGSVFQALARDADLAETLLLSNIEVSLNP